MADTKEIVDSSDSLACAASSSSSSCSSTAAVAASSSNNDESNSSITDNVSTTDNQNTEKDLLTEAIQCLQHGKRHMIVSDYRSAVPSFEQACQILDSFYGAGAPECGEAYLNYGIALFELSRLEEGIFDGVVKVESQVSSEEDDDDDEAEDNDGDEQQEPDNSESQDNEAEAKPTNEPVPEEKFDIDISQPSTSKGETSTNGPEKSDEEEEADNASNVEIAWEVLCLARNIFSQNMDSNENKLNLAEALQKLGEISIEWENNENAIHLLNECLQHRKEVLEPDNRLIAVTYHYLGVAFSFKCDYDKSNSCFENALAVIQLRLKHLKEKDVQSLDIIEKASHEREIEQLEGLIPELQAKIDDLKEQMQSQYKTLQTLEKESEQETKQVQVNQAKPVSNISHLIKRKRETNENGVENGAENVKKVCKLDVNGCSATSNNTETQEANEAK